MSLIKNDKAPAFELYNSEFKKITSANFIGQKNVLLLFFPFAFTNVCTEELCGVRDDISRYTNDNTEVLGISVDSVFTLAQYKADQKLNFDLLSDFNKVVSDNYGSLYESFTNMDFKGVSKRSAFIIDKKGIIQYAEVLDNAGEVPDFEAINEILGTLD